MQVNARFTLDKVVFNQDNNLHLVVSLTAPQVPVAAVRRPILVMPVLDISGSMDGQKLEHAKDSILKLIEHLQSTDFCGLATFESEVKLVQNIMPMTPVNKEQLKFKVKNLNTAGSTAFAGGMLLGLQEANKASVPAETLARVIMFTDGQANVGPRGHEILDLLTPNAELLKTVSLSAFGYGIDADQDLLATLAARANGNYAFIKNPDDAPTAFARELGGLISTYAQNIRVEVVTKENNKITKVLSDVKQVSEGSGATVSLPQVLSEETVNLVFAFNTLKISQADSLFETAKAEVVNVKVTYDIIDNGVMKSHILQTGASLEFVNPGEEQRQPTPEVDAIVALAQMTQAQVEAEKLALAGQYQAAFTVMNMVSDDIGTRGHEAISGTAAKLGSKMRSRVDFTTSAGYRRSAYAGSVKSKGLSLGDAEAEQDLKSLGVNTSNEYQESLVESFNADEKK